MKETLLTIILEYFNSDTVVNLHRALTSICEQTLQNLEILCLGCSDNDFVKCAMEELSVEFSHFNVTVLPATSETGLKLSRNDAILSAKGEYIFLMKTTCNLEAFTWDELMIKVTEAETDIFHFMTKISSPTLMPDSHEIVDAQSSIRIFDDQISDKMELWKRCYIEKSINTDLYDKVFRASALKTACSMIGNREFGFYSDHVLFVLLCLNGGKYVGDKGRAYQMKHFLSETTSFDIAEYFKKVEDSNFAYQFLAKYHLGSNCVDAEESVQEQIRNDLLRDPMNTWQNGKFPYEHKIAGAKAIIDSWGEQNAICGFAEVFSRFNIECAWDLTNLFREGAFHPVRNIGVAAGKKLFNDLVSKYGTQYRFFHIGPQNVNESEGGSKKSSDVQGRVDEYERYETLRVNIISNKLDTFICSLEDQYAFSDMLLARLMCVRTCFYVAKESSLTEVYRDHDTATFLYSFVLLMQAHVSVIPKNACTDHFQDLGIRYVDDETLLPDVLEAAENRVLNCSDIANRLYLYRLLAEKYKQRSWNLERSNKYVAAFSGLRDGSLDVRRMELFLRQAILTQMLHEASVFGKLKLLGKIVLKFFGLVDSLGVFHYSATARRSYRQDIKKALKNLKLLLTSPTDLVKKIKQKLSWRDYFQKQLSYGDKNKDINFYIIRLYPGNEGLLLSYLRLLRELRTLDSSSYVPVIDMRWAFYLMAHNKASDKGKINGWELYFEPVAGYPLNEVMQSKNVTRGLVCYREQVDDYFRSNVLKNSRIGDLEDFKEWCRLDHKYMKLNTALQNRFAQSFDTLIGGKRTIGVMIREGYIELKSLNFALINGHPVQPELEQIICDIKQKLKEWNCEQVFISTEFSDTVEAMQSAFGDKLRFVERKRKRFSGSDLDDHEKERKEYYQQTTRQEINNAYLNEVYILSRCTCLIAGRASASIVAALWNNGMYEHRYIYELGNYMADMDRPQVSTEE